MGWNSFEGDLHGCVFLSVLPAYQTFNSADPVWLRDNNKNK